jgi:hypothetical protein
LLHLTGAEGAQTFSDVPPTHPNFDDIEWLYGNGYVAGCGTNPLRYCPDQALSRAEAAVFVERGLHGVAQEPPQPEAPVFGDVAPGAWYAKWVHQLWEDGFTAGCGVNPLLFCPAQGHTRAEGAVFFVRMLHNDPGYNPSPPGGLFADVPTDHWGAGWIEEAYRAGMLQACETAPLRFCPSDPLTRGEAATVMRRAKSGPDPTPTPTPSPGPLPAFPGAQGFGSMTIGGRGGRIIEVTNLNDSGPGSFRQAVELESGPRIVVFRTGGVIHAASRIRVQNPYVTIAGQTAPGNGIVLAGASLSIQTHDVIVRGLRMRIGDGPGESSTTRDGIGISGFDSREVYNVIVDHNSIAWGVDENMQTWDNSSAENKVHDITFSWNISAEALHCSIHIDEGASTPDCHSMGMLIGEFGNNITVHHNLLAFNHFRNPDIQEGVTVELINNVVYGWGNGPTTIGGRSTSIPSYVNIIGNYYKPTAGTVVRQGDKKGIYVTNSLDVGSKIYVRGNVGPGRLTDAGDDWNAVVVGTLISIPDVRVNTSALVRQSGIIAATADAAYTQVLAGAGATAPSRDPVDTRILNNILMNLQPAPGKWLIDSEQQVGGLPSYPAGTPPADADHDGMPDSWELAHGGDLNPSSTAPSGYTWVEEYINSLIRGAETSP